MKRFEIRDDFKKILQGTIIMYGACDETEEDMFVISSDKRVLVKDNPKYKIDKKKYIGKVVDYVVEHIDRENNLIFGKIEYSKNTMASIKKDLYHNTLGTIEKILDWGAFININGTQVKALNKDIFKDNTRIFEVFKEGDMIDNLKLKYVEKTALEVELNVKLNSPERGVKKEDLKKGKEFEGTIRTIMPTACFVYILNDRDVICSIPDQLEEDIQIGSKVIVRLTTVSKLVEDNNKLRGKVVKIIEG
ncbi:hypothetical protein EAI30_06835 [Romboutsia ilealis]|uniref:S1 motif domain-containing protein n=1 Tax=Romboutsia faecis TaxID=2764597 RepID=A0ABR7JKI7_9FIRM|nr:hypothetical protein [Romboutsia faecis]MBC5995430.1 hypothetical protein [Romboutsia faecis]MRN24327.1 hypothetical protein [Romboutsia ilealis]